ncbi:MAG: DNA mismatch repair protein MutS [Candidatus Firestonebacteria bacterium RIFOXYA2_FULL_40_8]|nr:MAG: DNA mismatch repair protein MutS [Candidatus Firestonebacteria bacterium RIFOXYA2_FULL_40_8]
MDKNESLTPMMRQYREIKKQYPDAILFFRLGDFYEMFFEDAKLASSILQIVLTKRGGGRNPKEPGETVVSDAVPMCGIPFHSSVNYITRLIKSGHKVAICEQVEDPKLAKGLVKREIVKIITPGTVLEDGLLEQKSNNFLASLCIEGETAGLAFLDISTGELLTTEVSIKAGLDSVYDELTKFKPKEIILPASFEKSRDELHKYLENNGILTGYEEDYYYDSEVAKELLLKQFKIASLDGFGISEYKASVSASGVALKYAESTQKGSVAHLSKLSVYNPGTFMLVDSATRRNLELFERMADKSQEGTLFHVLDKTSSAMGGRVLKRWILEPLIDVKEIESRQEGVEELLNDYILRQELRKVLGGLSDLERICGKIGCKAVNARELIALKNSLKELPKIKEVLNKSDSGILMKIKEDLALLKTELFLLEEKIEEDPPISVKEGNIIKDGVNEELDKLRNVSRGGKDWITKFQEDERKRTGINSLKVGYNSVFGYYIEVSKANMGNAPKDYIRKQTLSNAERFITPELKEYESLVLSSDEKISSLEYQLFCEVREELAKSIPKLQENAKLLGSLDAVCAFSEAAAVNKYIKPEVNNSDIIEIKSGRHPVIELIVKDGFVPNDTILDNTDTQVVIITGPNMAGKSTYLRQTALIVLMAQIGSFVPADSAKIGVVDRIFTRVGASDNLALGQSTFMVEMLETANILNNATKKSLLILDEIGRGTATFDGISIAWAVAEYIHDNKKLGAKTLFATHFYELTELALTLPRVKNYNIMVKEWNDQIIFLRKIVEGAADRSYGIQVARLAGLPKEVLKRSKEILHNLEEANYDKEGKSKLAGGSGVISQLSIFDSKKPVVDDKGRKLLEKLEEIDVNALSPIEALNVLNELKKGD